MDLLKNMVYYLPGNMVIKDGFTKKLAPGGRELKDMLDALDAMSIDVRRIHECHFYFQVDVDGYCTDSSLTPSASAIG